jgi:multidrug efflux system membrane fusion protein
LPNMTRSRPLFPRAAKIGAGIAVLLIVAYGARGFLPASKPAAPAAPLVSAEKAVRQSVPVYRYGYGTVRALNSVVLKTRVDGTLDKVTFKEGQDVKAGDVLAQIDPRPFHATLNQALAKKAQDEALLIKARGDLARYQALNRSQFTSQQALEAQQATAAQVEATVKADDAQIESARLQLLYTTITAPISGRIGLRQVDAGNILRAADVAGLAVISQVHPISVTFNLPAAEVPAINKAMAHGVPPVTAYTSDDKEKLAEGELLTIDSMVDDTSGTIKLKATFANEDNSLWPGQSVSAHVLLNTVRDVLTIPAKAVQRGPNGLFVYVVQPDSTVTVKAVETGETFGDIIAVSGTIAAGDLVVTNGHSRLQPGARVTVAADGKTQSDADAKAEPKG